MSDRRAPELRRVRVVGVRLYNDSGPLEIDMEKPISAFVGANGIGKSTLLALINFGLTGLVPSPSLSFQSVEEFAERTSSFASQYFSGRVDESHRQAASVLLEFRLGQANFLVERGLFDGRLIRTLQVDDPENAEDETGSDDGDSPSDLALVYQRAVVRASGLANFDQFCFWQLFMMTFDERRHLLFWDERTLQSVLLISLGRSPQDAVEAEALSRNIERQDSLARNARWRATQATNKRRRLLRDVASGSQLTDAEFLALQESHEALKQAEWDARARLDANESELKDTSRTVAELAIRESELEQSYLKLFSRSGARKDPHKHPLVSGLLGSGECDLCGLTSTSMGTRAQAALAGGRCPMCDSDLAGETSDHSNSEELVAIDLELARVSTSVNEARARFHRLREENATASEVWRSAWQELEAFLGDHDRHLDPEQASKYKDEVQQYDYEIADAMKDAETHRETRDEYRAALEPIITGLVGAYMQIETVFVPAFRSLAEQFIGRSVDIEFERRGVNVGLRFGLDGQSRRNASELSESQQYFLDIALRMSIIQTFLTDTCTLIVDTPEGSLDIAYETRAGLLFDKFSKSGHSIVMMSNLNASNLLTKLTRLSTVDDMEIFKMIDWSKLSDVQIDSSLLFDEVYDRLQRSLEAPVEDS